MKYEWAEQRVEFVEMKSSKQSTFLSLLSSFLSSIISVLHYNSLFICVFSVSSFLFFIQFITNSSRFIFVFISVSSVSSFLSSMISVLLFPPVLSSLLSLQLCFFISLFISTNSSFSNSLFLLKESDEDSGEKLVKDKYFNFRPTPGLKRRIWNAMKTHCKHQQTSWDYCAVALVSE
jgi:hypothetical protein